jgi:hypothetical protein
MVQSVLVAVIVTAAVLYSAWLFMPGAARRSAAARLAAFATRCGMGERRSLRLQARLVSHSGCGDCESCKGCSPPSLSKAAAMQQQNAGVETRNGQARGE